MASAEAPQKQLSLSERLSRNLWLTRQEEKKSHVNHSRPKWSGGLQLPRAGTWSSISGPWAVTPCCSLSEAQAQGKQGGLLGCSAHTQCPAPQGWFGCHTQCPAPRGWLGCHTQCPSPLLPASRYLQGVPRENQQVSGGWQQRQLSPLLSPWVASPPFAEKPQPQVAVLGENPGIRAWLQVHLTVALLTLGSSGALPPKCSYLQQPPWLQAGFPAQALPLIFASGAHSFSPQHTAGKG